MDVSVQIELYAFQTLAIEPVSPTSSAKSQFQSAVVAQNCIAYLFQAHKIQCQRALWQLAKAR
jgi:hypothetical protein